MDSEHSGNGERGGSNDGHRHETGEPPLPARLRASEDRATGDYVYEKGSLLAAWNQVDRVRNLLTELEVEVHSVERVASMDVAQIDVADEDRGIPEIVDELRERGGPDLDVGPNHALALASHGSWIPVAAPRPAKPPKGADARRQAGAGVRVGVLDTGAWDHPYFDGRVEFRVPEDVDEPDVDGDGRLDYPAGHGTFIAGVVLQHAPGATVLARRLPCDPSEVLNHGYVTDAVLAASLAELTELRDVDVLSLSVGGYTHDGMGLLATQEILTDYLAHNPDLVIVAGAGNDCRTDPFFPAAMKRVVGVGALDGDGQRACFSNHGWWVDACAPGTDLHGTFLEWNGELAPYPTTPPKPCEGVLPGPPVGRQHFKGWATWDGTSFAAPAVAAAIAVRISEGRTGPEAVFDVVHAPGCHRLPGIGTVVDR